MLIDSTSEEFKKLFAGMDLHAAFQSRLPSHDLIVASLSDPSIDPYGTESPVNLNLVNFQNVTDLKVGTKHMLKQIVLPGAADGTFGFLKSSTAALENIMLFESVPEFLTNDGVFEKLGVATGGKKPADAIKGVAYAVGMSALSAMGPVGAAAAAIIGFGIALANAFKSIKRKNAEEEEQKILNAYAEFPPLSEPGSDLDNHEINTRLLPTLQTGDWTSIFSPRFSGSSWRGIPRLGGFALAPGEETGDLNPLGQPEQRFVPTGGVGFWPGQNRIASILQVKLDPRMKSVRERVSSGFTPNNAFQQGMVQDVGDFLVSTTKLAAIAWSWVSDLENSPHLYKVDVATLHQRWAKYCRSGIALITDDAAGKYDNLHFYKGAIACSVGSWQCWFEEGTYKNIKGKAHGWDMLSKAGPNAFHPNREKHQGCVIGPFDARSGCLSNIYDQRTKLVLDEVSKRQRWYLRHSLLCAYVRKSWAAFRDPGLRNLLDEMRMLLLEHHDRQYIVLEDVPDGEKLPNGRDLRTELIKRGAGKKPSGRLSFSARPAIQKPKDPPPALPPPPRMPFDLAASVPDTTPWWKHQGVIAIGLSALVGGGLYAWNKR